MTSVAIIDYGSGNLRSVAKAFELFSDNVKVTSDAKVVADASHIVLPGVGAFADCMIGLNSLPGMVSTMREQVLGEGKLFLGICVGMQMLFEQGHEYGVHKGLGWLSGDVVPLSKIKLPKEKTIKIPHMGWNELFIDQKSLLLTGIENGEHVYFVHGYYADIPNNLQLLASVEYGETIPAVVGKKNIFGTQFHPEKSQKTGLRIIENFVRL